MDTETKKLLIETAKEAILEVVVLVANKISETANKALVTKRDDHLDTSLYGRPSSDASDEF